MSELRKPRPDPGFTAWIASIPERLLFLSSVTIGELRLGIDLVVDACKEARPRTMFVSGFTMRFGSRILAFDETVPKRWGRLEAVGGARRAHYRCSTA